jgi:hypothetical protein
VIWACFYEAVCERQKMDEFAADWAIATHEDA